MSSPNKHTRNKTNTRTTTKGTRGNKKFPHGKGKKNFLINGPRKKGK
jgi:hypothetical protein